jgi:glycosyltransferase involved in cell wall biosynthesis
MRVLLVSGEFPPMQGGVADFTHLLARHMVALGAEVQVLTSTSATTPGGYVQALRVWPLVARWGWPALARALRSVRAQFAPDIIDIQYQTAAYGLHPAINTLPLWAGAPCVTTFHDLRVPYLFPKAGALRWHSNLMLARASAASIVTNAEDCQTLAQAHVDYVHLIPIGSNIRPLPRDEADRLALRRAWQVPDKAIVLCYFGFLNDSKGGEDLIEALALVKAAGVPCKLVMIGAHLGASDPTNAAYLARVRSLIRERGVEHLVVWTGHLSEADVSRAFHASDLCLLPYRDGVSFRRGSLMAALAHGLPIISTQPAVPLPQVTHGDNIWLLPAGAPSELGDAVLHLAQDGALRQRLAAGAARLATSFGWEAIAAQTSEVLSHAL